MDFSTAVKAQMKALGLSVSDLSRRTGYSAPYIYELLGGRKRWNEETMCKFCTALSLHIEVKPFEPTGTDS